MEKIAKMLLDIQAVKLSPDAPFTWASGWKSPIYCNNRKLLAYPLERGQVVFRLAELVMHLSQSVDAVLGVATGAIAWGALVADQLNVPCGYVRSEKKDHGLKTMIEGFEPEALKGKSVVIVEDLVSTGSSSLRAVQTVREAGANVVGMVAIFSYQFPQAKQAFLEADVRLKTATDYLELLDMALDEGFLTEADKPWLSDWRKSPETWGQNQN